MKNSKSIFSFGKKITRVTTLSAAMGLSFTTGVLADDTDIFLAGTTVPPNVLFVLDTSGSMRVTVPGGGTRMEVMQAAMIQLLENASNINVGLINFTTADQKVRAPIANIDTELDSLKEAIEELRPAGGTPTLRALWNARQFFRGELETADGTGMLPTPIVNECQANHVVLITDGVPDDDEIVDTVESTLFPVTQEECPTIVVANNEGDSDNGTCAAEFANFMFLNDLSDTLPGDNTIITHTIGFDFSEPWLETISDPVTGGGGTHHLVQTPDGLQAAFESIFEGLSATFSAPAISTDSFNESRHRDELFYSQFQPYDSVRWNGNVKKYRLLDGEIIDADEDPLVNANGIIDPNSRSLWSDVPDGANIADGGFAHELPDYTDRNWYTDIGQTANATGVVTPIKVTAGDFDEITLAALDADDDAERDTLMSWALGSDVQDTAENDDNHHFIADALHNSPVLLSYSATKDVPQTHEEIVFTANNLGVLHAVDADTGRELWSYTPEEHLDNIKPYFEDATTTNHVYGLDGSFTLHSTRVETETLEYDVNKAWLYMTERRGGNRVYGLDVTNGLSETDPFKVMWKITGGTAGPFDRDTDADGVNDDHWFADLAQTWSKPELMTVQYDCANGCKTKDVLMFGGGYNPVYDDVDLNYATFNTPADSHGNAVYFVDPQTGERLWSVGNGGHSLNLNGMDHSVPSTPVPVDTDFDGTVDLLFFVDLAGDVWRVDFDDDAPNLNQLHLSGGQIAELSPQGQSLRFFNPLDVAISGTTRSTSFFYLVTGSGMRSSPQFQEPNLNRLYSVTDRWLFDAPFRTDANTGEKLIDYRYVDEGNNVFDIIRADPGVIRDVSDTGSNTSVEHGFFRPFEPGEKILQATRIHRSRVFTTSYVPPVDLSVDPCSSQIGSTRLYITSLPDGENLVPDDLGTTYIEVGDGLLSNGQIIDTGHGEAPYFLIDKKVFSLKELVAPDNTEVFRKFKRTGWVELDEY